MPRISMFSQFPGQAVLFDRSADINSKLVHLQSRGDVRVRLGVNIGIDAETICALSS